MKIVSCKINSSLIYQGRIDFTMKREFAMSTLFHIDLNSSYISVLILGGWRFEIKHWPSVSLRLCLLWTVPGTPGKTKSRNSILRYWTYTDVIVDHCWQYSLHWPMLTTSTPLTQVNTMASLTHPASTVLLSYERRPEKGFSFNYSSSDQNLCHSNQT